MLNSKAIFDHQRAMRRTARKMDPQEDTRLLELKAAVSRMA